MKTFCYNLQTDWLSVPTQIFINRKYLILFINKNLQLYGNCDHVGNSFCTVRKKNL